ncbi:MAG: hypothetical protein JW942_08715 [Opitutales bacterium]|nr:hypothetical protein [Opitutales bacterium]
MLNTSSTIALALLASAVTLNAYDAPALVGTSVSDRPYSLAGMVYAPIEGTNSFYLGSAYLINKRVVQTCAHVFFDEESMSWMTDVRFHRAFNSQASNVDGVRCAGTTYLSSYSSAVQQDIDDGLDEGQSSYNTFDSDIACAYALSDFYTQYGNYSARLTGEPSLAAEGWNAMLVGYPSDDTYIASDDIGKMHKTGAPSPWILTDFFGYNNGEYDGSGTNSAIYENTGDIQVISGNSGGPLLVYDEDIGEYVLAAVVVGGTSEASDLSTIFRIIDDSALTVIDAAISSSGSGEVLGLTTLSAIDNGNSTSYISWSTSASTGQSGWQVSRHEGDAWVVVATLADSGLATMTWTDPDYTAGHGFSYRVRPVKYVSSTWSNKGPWSNAVTLANTEYGDAIAEAVGAPYLYLSTNGDAPFYASSTEDGASSGKILNHQESVLNVHVNYPGKLSVTFDLDCDTRSYSANQFDKLLFTNLNGFTSFTGTYSSRSVSGNISADTAKLTYSKNGMYASDADRALVRSIEFYPTGTSALIPGCRNKDQSGTAFESPWLGDFYAFNSPWIFAYNGLGYAYVTLPSETVWKNTHGLWMYLPDGEFSWLWIDTDDYPWLWSYSKGWVYYMHSGWFWVSDAARYEQLGTGEVVYP